MSIIRACVRLAALAALRDRMWEAAEIFDSDNRPLQDAVEETPRPYVVVFTDDDDNTEIEAREATASPRTLTLVIEFGIAAPMEATPPGQGPTVAIPPTDGAFELLIDMLDSQVVNALIHDSGSRFGEFFRLLCPEVQQMTGKRGGAAEKGARWAVRQRVFMLTTLIDPPLGAPLGPNHPVTKFLAAAEASDDRIDVAGAVPLIRSVLSTDAATSWRLAQQWLGITNEAVRGIGVAPPDVVIPDDVEAPQLEEVDNPGTTPVPPGPATIEGIP